MSPCCFSVTKFRPCFKSDNRMNFGQIIGDNLKILGNISFCRERLKRRLEEIDYMRDLMMAIYNRKRTEIIGFENVLERKK